jgi:transposase
MREVAMSGYIEGISRNQVTLFPDRLDDWIDDDHPARLIEAFVEAMDLAAAGFGRMSPAQTGRPCYHPSVLLKLFIYGYLNRIPSSRRLEREAGRNVEVMWLGATHFQMRRLKNVRTEMALHVLAYNIKRMINMIGVRALIRAMAA